MTDGDRQMVSKQLISIKPPAHWSWRAIAEEAAAGLRTSEQAAGRVITASRRGERRVTIYLWLELALLLLNPLKHPSHHHPRNCLPQQGGEESHFLHESDLLSS